MISLQDFDRILENSTDVLDQNGDKIGGVGQLYVNDSTGAPSFVTVRTGMFGTRETFVPLDSASYDGENIVVPFTADQVKDAPQVDEGGAITPEDEETIYNFYGVDGVGGAHPGEVQDQGEQLGGGHDLEREGGLG
ncbi:MAG: PRC-barrel domain-containing protein, partial [bacterium]|nr:PRC-barrel domain-containing protein [bacterium]